MATYYFNVPTEETIKYFKKGQWYKSNLQNIVALYSGNPGSNDGYWGKEFYQGYFRMITPDEWSETEKPRIEFNIERATKI